jgi:hypothetical protein
MVLEENLVETEIVLVKESSGALVHSMRSGVDCSRPEVFVRRHRYEGR